MPIYLQPQIDKFRVGIACTGQEFSGACERLKFWAEEYKLPWRYLGNGSGVGLSIPQEKFGFGLYIAVRTMYGKSYRISYEMNGTALNAKGLLALQASSEKYFSLIDLPKRDFRAALLGGEFTYLEVCRDFPYKNSLDLLMHQVGSGVSSRFCKAGNLGTQKSGEKGGLSRMVLYDKSAELAAKGKKGLLGGLVRLERKMTHALSLIDLLELEKPFLKARIYSVEKLRAMNVHPSLNWFYFIEFAKTYGVAEALSKLTEHEKKIFRTALEQGQVDWFKPTQWNSEGWEKNVLNRLHITEFLPIA